LLLEAEWNAGEGEDGGGELGGLRHSKTVGGSLALLLYRLKRKKNNDELLESGTTETIMQGLIYRPTRAFFTFMTPSSN